MKTPLSEPGTVKKTAMSKTPFDLHMEKRATQTPSPRNEDVLADHRRTFEAGVRAVLATIGAEQKTCSKCQAPMWFVRHMQSGKYIPVSAAGCSHFANCPEAASFRKEKT